MKEIRKDNNIQIQFRNEIIAEGKVVDYLSDRVLVQISDSTTESASMLRELDDIVAIVETHLGIKQMHSCVITTLNKNNRIIIENNDAISVSQKREYVRVSADFSFCVKDKNDISLRAQCVNISAGGIAFNILSGMLNIGDEVLIILGKNEFGKEIECLSKIIKMDKDTYIAQYVDLNPHDKDKIVKYVFSLMIVK